jgi:O-antigen/teichoic acid export membrane protein
MIRDVVPTPSNRRRLGTAWLLTTATNTTLGLAAFLVTPWAANILGPDNRGRLTAIQLVPQILADLSSVGLAFSIVHFGSARRSSIGTLLRWSAVPALGGTAVMF